MAMRVASIAGAVVRVKTSYIVASDMAEEISHTVIRSHCTLSLSRRVVSLSP